MVSLLKVQKVRANINLTISEKALQGAVTRPLQRSRDRSYAMPTKKGRNARPFFCFDVSR
jgi:hypothetical protein